MATSESQYRPGRLIGSRRSLAGTVALALALLATGGALWLSAANHTPPLGGRLLRSDRQWRGLSGRGGCDRARRGARCPFAKSARRFRSRPLSTVPRPGRRGRGLSDAGRYAGRRATCQPSGGRGGKTSGPNRNPGQRSRAFARADAAGASGRCRSGQSNRDPGRSIGGARPGRGHAGCKSAELRAGSVPATQFKSLVEQTSSEYQQLAVACRHAERQLDEAQAAQSVVLDRHAMAIAHWDAAAASWDYLSATAATMTWALWSVAAVAVATLAWLIGRNLLATKKSKAQQVITDVGQIERWFSLPVVVVSAAQSASQRWGATRSDDAQLACAACTDCGGCRGFLDGGSHDSESRLAAAIGQRALASDQPALEPLARYGGCWQAIGRPKRKTAQAMAIAQLEDVAARSAVPNLN